MPVPELTERPTSSGWELLCERVEEAARGVGRCSRADRELPWLDDRVWRVRGPWFATSKSPGLDNGGLLSLSRGVGVVLVDRLCDLSRWFSSSRTAGLRTSGVDVPEATMRPSLAILSLLSRRSLLF